MSSRARTAQTLLEVIASLALAAGVLTGLLLAQARSLEQLAATRDVIQASALARELIAQWELDPTGTPQRDAGTFGHSGQWSWTCTRWPSSLVQDQGTVEAMFTVYRAMPSGEGRALITLTWLENITDDGTAKKHQ